MIDSNVRIFSLHMKAYVDASYYPRFFFDSFVKIRATCENFWAHGSPLPTAKNCPYADEFRSSASIVS